eukprot:CAMPEP_0117614184 /NCGR_PEP_ID=MMETSP0784-20121206/83897_1 /TAXON_ID=39447 /ORGANISM="" /LENGTH=53 /DNA_ID=CAMNT_0005417889 /DNA_START=26 /DNA_END=183 /DNA_ORIENTATION=+
MSKASATANGDDDGVLGVVRIKPLGAGGGGGEAIASGGSMACVQHTAHTVTLG